MAEGDFLRSGGQDTASLACAAANKSKPSGYRRNKHDYKNEFQGFHGSLSKAEQELLPKPEMVAQMLPSAALAYDKEPQFVKLSSSSLSPKMAHPGGSGGGASPSMSANTPEFTPKVASATSSAVDPFFGMPYPNMMEGYPPMYPMAHMAGMSGWPSWDPTSGNGGMPYPGMPYPGMMPGMMPGMGMMPGIPPGMGKGRVPPPAPALGKGGGGGKGEPLETAGTKTRERRRRKNKSGTAADAEKAAEPDEDAADRSDELKEARRTGGKCKLTLDQVLPQAVDFARDQHGSRFLQAKLEESNDPADLIKVLEAVLPKTKELSKDQYGNHVVQKLFDMCHNREPPLVEEKRRLAVQLEGAVLALSMDQHGCRVIQKALGLLPRHSTTKLAKELYGQVLECIEDQHGNHVIQKCIEILPSDTVNFVIDAVSSQIEEIAEHRYGCRVIQRLLEHCDGERKSALIDKIAASIARLSQNAYGNYVVQHMLEHGRQQDKQKILRIVSENITEFANHKNASNVVEKCFEIATVGEHADQLKDDRAALFQAVLELRPGETLTPLQKLCEDKFGNYIVQRMLEHSRGEERTQIKEQLLTRIEQIKSSPNGKHILAALQKELGISVPAGDDQ